MPQSANSDRSPYEFATDEEFSAWFKEEMARVYGLVTSAPRTGRRRRPSASDSPYARVRRVELRLQAQFPPPLRKRVEIVKMKAPSAFAAPGRSLYITLPLLKRLESDDAVAMVIGHEIAHCELGHLLEFRRLAQWREAPGGEAFAVARYLVQRFVASPQNERDADAYGLDLAIAAGYDGEACLEAFAVLERLMRKTAAGRLLVDGTDAGSRETDNVADEWKARAELWLYEHLTGYPALAERRRLAERLDFHRREGQAPLILPGSRRSTTSLSTGHLRRREAIDAEIAECAARIDGLAASAGDRLRLSACRRLADALAGNAAGLAGRSAREAEEALVALNGLITQLSAVADALARSRDIRTFLDRDEPPLSALKDLESLLFGIRSGEAIVTGVTGNGAPSGTLKAILGSLERAFNSCSATVRAAERSWLANEPGLASVGEDLILIADACAAACPERLEAMRELTDRTRALAVCLRSDPLAFDGKKLQDLRKRVDVLRLEVRDLVARRRQALRPTDHSPTNAPP